METLFGRIRDGLAMEYELRIIGDKVEVDARGNCGKPTFGVAVVHELYSENPILDLRIPLGISGVEEIIKKVKEIKR